MLKINPHVGTLSAALLALCLTFMPALSASSKGVPEVTAEDIELWDGIRDDLFDGKTIEENHSAITLEAPYRAEDAALVPLTIRIPENYAKVAKKVTLVIEKNPAPLAAAFTFGEAAGAGERVITTRVRVDMYSNIRAILETEDGQLSMATKFVKAAGGCSAPALKDMDEAIANIGKMKLRWVSNAQSSATKAKSSVNQSTPMAVAQVMIKHPNYSGMQMNQVTGLYIPAKFVKQIIVKKGDRTVLAIEGGISLSENPNIRFTYAAGEAAPMVVTVTDTDGKTFKISKQPKSS